MMHLLKVFVCLCMLLTSSGLYAASVQQRDAGHYLEDYPEGWTKIVPDGETVIVANFASLKIRVNIKTHTVDIGKYGDKPDPVQMKRSNCTYSRYPCSVVDYIDISVNGKQLLFPNSVFCDLTDLNEGIVITEKKNMALLLTGADAATAYFVKIEFNRMRITRKNFYVGFVLSDETIYHY